MPDSGLQQFGGGWTEQKLSALSKYLSAYTQALKNQPFNLLYIDAFAGTGYREIVDAEEPDFQINLLEEDIDAEQFLDGSAKISLDIPRPFDRYLFIEKDKQKCSELCAMTKEYEEKGVKISCRNNDCNEVLQDFCRNFDWKKWRAVLFLDPFGMNVSWETMQAVARTQTIDVWILFPLGSAVNRLLMRDGDKIPEAWSNRLDDIFGTHSWMNEFYTRTTSVDLFAQEHNKLEKTGNLQAIARFYVEQLKTIFATVAENPKLMYNSRQNPLFMLCFAVGNPAPVAGKLALKIANNILNKV